MSVQNSSLVSCDACGNAEVCEVGKVPTGWIPIRVEHFRDKTVPTLQLKFDLRFADDYYNHGLIACCKKCAATMFRKGAEAFAEEIEQFVVPPKPRTKPSNKQQ